MAKGRKTKPLKYNLYNRGRKYTGQDRSNVDFTSMIDLINSQPTQEMVETGQMIGFYGHQVRQRFGMTPPESVPIDGKMVYLEPAFKTIELKAEKDGTVTHRAEFFDNASGEFARQQYLSKVGGFSTAVNYRRQANRLVPSGFFGFDYVLQPNYATNVGDGQLYDGLFVPENHNGEVACFDSSTDVSVLNPSQAMIAALLEQQIIQNYDNIHAQLSLCDIANQAYSTVEELQRQLLKQERKQELIEQRKRDYYTGMVAEKGSFDSAIVEADKYLEHLDQQIKKAESHKKGLDIGGLGTKARQLFGFGG